MREKLVLLFFLVSLNTFSNTWIFNDWSACNMQNCIYNPKINYVTVYEVISDEFSGSVLNRNWIFEVGQYNGLNRGAVTLSEKVDGWLTIKNLDVGAPVPITQWILNNNTSTKIFQIVKSSDNFEIETFLTTPSKKPDKIHDQHQGIFYYQDDQNALGIELAVSDDPTTYCSLINTWQIKNGIAPFYNIDTIFCNPNYPNPVTTQGLCLKLEKIGNNVNVYYKYITQTSWILFKSYNNIIYNVGYIGIFHWDDNYTDAYANFDYFRITGTSSTGSSGALFTPIIDLGATPKGTGILS